MGMDEQQPQPYDDIAAAGAPATPDALRSIVARHQRTRTRTLGIALAIALVAGPIAGWAVGHAGGGGQQVATGSAADQSKGGTPAAANAPRVGSAVGPTGEAFFPGEKAKTTHLFTRTTAGGIAIRAYRTDPPPPPSTTSTVKGQEAVCPKPMASGGSPGAQTGVVSGGSGSATASASASSGEAGTSTGGGETAPAPPPPAPPPSVVNQPPQCAPLPPICKATSSVLAEVSNDAAVGQSFDPIDDKQPSEALSHLAVAGFGVPEGSPATFVTVQVGPGVTDVRLRLPSGAVDNMAPVGGVAVLALAGSQPPPDGTVVEALNANKDVVGSMPVGGDSRPKAVIACAYAAGPVEAKPLPAPASPPTTR